MTTPEHVCMAPGPDTPHNAHDWWYTSSGGGHQLSSPDPTERNVKQWRCPGVPTPCDCLTNVGRQLYDDGDPFGCYCTCSDDGREDCVHAEGRTLAICPECEQGKHGNCDGTAWDDSADAEAPCTCPHPKPGQPEWTPEAVERLRAALNPSDRRPYVGDGVDGARRSAEIDRNEADCYDRDSEDYARCMSSAASWEEQAVRLELAVEPVPHADRDGTEPPRL